MYRDKIVNMCEHGWLLCGKKMGCSDFYNYLYEKRWALAIQQPVSQSVSRRQFHTRITTPFLRFKYYMSMGQIPLLHDAFHD